MSNLTIQEALVIAKLQNRWKSSKAIFNKLDEITQEEADMNLYQFVEYADQVMADVEKSMKEHKDAWK